MTQLHASPFPPERSRSHGVEPRADSPSPLARLAGVRAALSGWTACALGAAALWGALAGGGSSPALAASGGVSGDSDGDGLSDRQENVLGTRIDLVDTDGDGVSDLWEVARQSDPLVAGSVPQSDGPRVGMAGFVEDQVLTVTSALLIPGGDLAGVDFEFGLAIGGETAPIASRTLLSASTVRILSGSGSDVVMVLETSVPESWVHTIGNAAFYVVGRDPVRGDTADVMQMLSFPGLGPQNEPMPTLVRPEPAPVGIGSGPSLRPHRNGTGSGTKFAAGTVYRMLVADERIPSDWTAGQICYQEMSAVGVNGVNVVMQVDSAACEPFDTYCSPTNCQATVGQTIEFVDVGSILGG